MDRKPGRVIEPDLRIDGGDWKFPPDWTSATLVLVGRTADEATSPVALFQYADQAAHWAGSPSHYPGRFQLLTIDRAGDGARSDDLREEVVFWRRDAIARLWMAVALHEAAQNKRDHRRAAELRVGHIAPTLAALRDANAKEWHERCEGCGKLLRHDEPYQIIAVDQAGTTGRLHVACGDPSFLTCQPDPDDAEKVIADARQLIGLDAPANDVRGSAAEGAS